MENFSPIQLKILTNLLFHPRSRFRDLNTDSLTTDHFSYYLRLLKDGNYITKDRAGYSLTAKGKIAASVIDTATRTVEALPKISILLIPHRKRNGREEFLIQERTKEPYFGYWGFIAGKVRRGETLPETAKRELAEEAGLKGSFKFCYEIHEMVYDKNTKDQLEDKFFHVVEVTDLTGKLFAKTVEGHNRFVTVEEFRRIAPKYHNEDDLLTWFLNKDFRFKEEKYYINSF